MASGYGINGGTSRCFPFWQDLLACYVMNTSTGDSSGKWKCVPQVEDYYECLHHKKEIEKTKALRAAYIKWEQDNAAGEPVRQKIRKEGAIKALGLLDGVDNSGK